MITKVIRKNLSFLIFVVLISAVIMPALYIRRAFDLWTGYIKITDIRVSSDNFDWSPDGKSIVMLDRHATTIYFIDSNGVIESETSVAAQLLKISKEPNLEVSNLQWVEINTLSVQVDNKIYLISLETNQIQEIYAAKKRLLNYCWTTNASQLFVVEVTDELSRALTYIDIRGGYSTVFKDDIYTSYITCDSETAGVLAATGSIYTLDDASRQIRQNKQFPTTRNSLMTGFNSSQGEFIAIQARQRRNPDCIYFQSFQGDVPQRTVISKHERVNRIEYSPVTQTLLVGDRSSIYMIQLKFTDVHRLISPDLVKIGCGVE